MGQFNGFAALLDRYLNELDRSAAWLAKRLAVSESKISRWRNGERRPPLKDIEGLADVLSIYGRLERQALFEAAGYAYVEHHKSSDGEHPRRNESDETNKGESQPNSPNDVDEQSPSPSSKADLSPAFDFSHATFFGPVEATHIESLTIFNEDPPDVQLKKAQQRALLVAGEITFYMKNVDTRLGFVKKALQEDTFGDRLAEVRAKVAPILSKAVRADYDKLITSEMINGLRIQLNAYPLTNIPSPSILQLASESEVSPFKLRAFYEQLGEVLWATDTLLDTMTAKVKEKAREENWEIWVDYYARRIDLGEKMLHNRVRLVQAYGDSLIQDLQKAHSDIIPAPKPLIHLAESSNNKPQSLEEALAELAEETESLTEQRAALLAEHERLRDEDLVRYEALLDYLMIQPDDTWDIVSAKAISLRQFGHQDKAIDAFTQYGDMFAETDENAKQYASDARQFTIHMERLGVINGAVYIYAVLEDSPAQRVGIQARDILIAINRQPIQNMVDFQEALAQLSESESIEFEILHFDSLDIYQRQKVTVDEAQPFGIAMMPI